MTRRAALSALRSPVSGLQSPVSTQLPLPRFKPPAYARPTMELGTAAGVLSKSVPGITEDQVRELIDRGALWAWNLSERSDGKYHDLRLLTHSVSALATDDLEDLIADPYSLAKPTPETAEAAIATLTQHATRNTQHSLVTGKHLALVLCLRRTQLRRLIDIGALPEAPGTQRRTGPGGYPFFTPDTVRSFLESRLAV